MQCEERISKLPGKPQRTDREHLMIARAVDVGQHEEVFMVQLRASHESPPNPVIAAVSAVEPAELQRVRTHLWVKTTEKEPHCRHQHLLAIDPPVAADRTPARPRCRNQPLRLGPPRASRLTSKRAAAEIPDGELELHRAITHSREQERTTIRCTHGSLQRAS